MSRSSLYGIKKDYTGEEIKEYGNSWLFSPIVMGILPDKYIPQEIATPYGFKKSIIGLDGNDIWRKTNDKINNCDSTPDRICWEMSNQQIFYTKDKKCIADNIRQFVSDNDIYDKSLEDGISPLKRDHIIERFNEIASDIELLDETEYLYFVFKNTSCDDGVERWFSKYNEEIEEYEDKSLKEWDEFLAEFVIIENNKIKGFISNMKFEYK
jgi:hypothetical protein